MKGEEEAEEEVLQQLREEMGWWGFRERWVLVKGE